MTMKTLNLKRRKLLLGVVLSYLLAPAAALAGVRRSDRSSADGSLEDEAADDATAQESDGNKLSKEQAKYQSVPNGGQQCSNCQHFISGSEACKLVSGNIEPAGWSMLWTKKM
jgi:hypothetical protein